MPVVAIASQTGSQGDLIAIQVARRLGLTIMDHSSVLERLARQGLSAPRSDNGPRPKTLVQEKDWQADKIGKIISSEILFLAQKNSMLLLSPYAPHLLAGISHIPRIRVRAPLAQRARHFAATHQCSEADARREIALSDAQTDFILDTCFGVECPDLDQHFDLVADTGWLGTQEWSEEIINLVQDEEFSPSAASRSKLRALALHVSRPAVIGCNDGCQSRLPG